MGLKPDHWIKKMALEQRMIEPFAENQVRNGVISYGVSSYGYDIRVADEFKIFTNVFSAVVDPKHFDPKSMVDYKGEVCVIPPNSFALARTIEYFRIPRGVLTVCLGKCLTGDTRVVDATTGDYLPLKEFVASHSQETVALQDWRLGTRTVTAHVNNGLQSVYEVTTRAGLKIKATATHPFRTWQGWTPLADLCPGERIAVARTCPIFGKNDWPEHEALLLGLMLSDGQCHTPGHSPRYTTDDLRLVEVVTEAARAFGGEISPVGHYGYNLVNQRGRGGIVTRNRFYDWLERLGCNVRSADKFVPSVVFTARRERVVKFLQALFSGDGSVYSSGAGAFLEYYSVSERLAFDVRHLLLRFGIFALVRSKTLASGGTAYRVQITDRNMIRRFAEQIGFVPGSRKQQRLETLMLSIAEYPASKSNFDTLPPPAWELMRETVHASGHSLRTVGIPRTQPDQSLPYAIARQAAQAIDAPEFGALVESDVVWDTVTTIVPCGQEIVYDLTVPGAHNFLANDVIAHNSTYARCGIIVNVTPFEPEWEGYVTLEISNTTPLPARIYSNEGIAQVLFFEGDEMCDISYADKKGKYQKQQSIVLPKL
jgi:deoxycytidine triphosphate deaminase/intein/homing endonuclease